MAYLLHTGAIAHPVDTSAIVLPARREQAPRQWLDGVDLSLVGRERADRFETGPAMIDGVDHDGPVREARDHGRVVEAGERVGRTMTRRGHVETGSTVAVP